MRNICLLIHFYFDFVHFALFPILLGFDRDKAPVHFYLELFCVISCFNNARFVYKLFKFSNLSYFIVYKFAGRLD